MKDLFGLSGAFYPILTDQDHYKGQALLKETERVRKGLKLGEFEQKHIYPVVFIDDESGNYYKHVRFHGYISYLSFQMLLFATVDSADPPAAKISRVFGWQPSHSANVSLKR